MAHYYESDFLYLDRYLIDLFDEIDYNIRIRDKLNKIKLMTAELANEFNFSSTSENLSDVFVIKVVMYDERKLISTCAHTGVMLNDNTTPNNCFISSSY